jgi:serine phosphatase RsbU (regulator of sigma subunit)
MDIYRSDVEFDTRVIDRAATNGHLSSIRIRRDDELQTNDMQALITSFVRASFPPPLPEVDSLQFEAFYLSCGGSIIGGDWYDALELPDGSVAVALGDVTGHGVEAAVLMGKIRYSMRVLALLPNPVQTGRAAWILQSVEDGLRSEHPEASATVFLGIISADRRWMQYSIAGHPPPLVVKTAGETSWLDCGETPIGWGTGERTDRLVNLTGVRALILYSDGVVEAGRDIVKGLARLQKAIEDPDVLNSKELLPGIIEASLDAPPHDDIAMLAVTFD